jgi:non-homologous end joining protein Ku
VPKKEIDELYLTFSITSRQAERYRSQAFAVIREALRKEGMVAMGKVVFTSREHIIALEARGKGLLGVTLRYAYEVCNEADLLRSSQTRRFLRTYSIWPRISWKPNPRTLNEASSRTACVG